MNQQEQASEASEREARITWMATWAAKAGAQLTLEGECGFGRECVGILVNGNYPEYEWYDDATYERADNNGDVWTPASAYHKHPCVAVLGRGEDAESQLYEWLKWFEANGFKIESGYVKSPPMDMISMLMGRHHYQHMVRAVTPKEAA